MRSASAAGAADLDVAEHCRRGRSCGPVRRFAGHKPVRAGFGFGRVPTVRGSLRIIALRRFCLSRRVHYVRGVRVPFDRWEASNMAEGYCVKDKKKVEILNPVKTTMKNGKPATQGTCPICGGKIFRIGA
jgi:hypothetical protein